MPKCFFEIYMNNAWQLQIVYMIKLYHNYSFVRNFISLILAFIAIPDFIGKAYHVVFI